MRFNAFAGESPLDVQAVQCPWNDAVTFHIWRAGRREYADRSGPSGTAGYIKLLRALARKKKMTVQQLQETKAADLQAEMFAMQADEAMDTGALDMSGSELDLEGIARFLVDRVDGPAILADDSDAVLGWHDSEGDVEHCGLAFLKDTPDAFARWILDEARRIQAELDAFMEAAAGNLPTSSASNEAGEGVEGS